MNRRTFVIQGLSLSVTAPLLLGISKCDTSTSGMAKQNQAVTLANQSNNIYVFDFSDYPGIETVGGVIDVNINASSGLKRISIFRYSATVAYTVLMVCPYSGCLLSPYYSTTLGPYKCDCDPSVFDVDGSVLIGPSTVSLTTYPTVVSGSSVTVTVV